MNILFVCTGNTCRSPMCEGFFRKLVRDAKTTDLHCQSAGISACAGAPASPNAEEVMKTFGVDLSGHRAAALSARLVAEADRIVAMTESHRRAILAQYPDAGKKLFLLNEFHSDPSVPRDVADPFGGNAEVYRKCFGEMKGALENLFLDLSKSNSKQQSS